MTGAALYTVDVRHEGQLEALILRSPHARARVVALDLEPARSAAGVAAAVSLIDDDRMLTFVGQPVAAVAAADRKSALAALAAIKVDYEILPSVIGPEAARKAGAPILFPRGKGAKYNAGEGGGAPAFWSGNVRGPTSAFSSRKKSARRSIEQARAGGDPLLVRGRVPDRNPAAHVPRAARRRRPVRRRRADRPCLDPGRERAQDQDRQTVQARSGQG